MADTGDNNKPEQELILPDDSEAEDDQLPLPFSLDEMIELERERIDSTNRRTELAHRALELANDSDKRQFDFAMERLATDERRNLRLDNRAGSVIRYGGLALVAFLALIMIMLFWGNDAQSAIALSLIATLGTAVGGFGFFYAVIRLVSWLMGR